MITVHLDSDALSQPCLSMSSSLHVSTDPPIAYLPSEVEAKHYYTASLPSRALSLAPTPISGRNQRVWTRTSNPTILSVLSGKTLQHFPSTHTCPASKFRSRFSTPVTLALLGRLLLHLGRSQAQHPRWPGRSGRRSRVSIRPCREWFQRRSCHHSRVGILFLQF